MRQKKEFVLVLVTAPDLKVARRLVKAVLQARLAACANLLPKIESHYWWEGRLEKSREILIIFKTTTERMAALEKLVVDRHPYDTPEVLALPIARGNERYLNWLANSACG